MKEAEVQAQPPRSQTLRRSSSCGTLLDPRGANVPTISPYLLKESTSGSDKEPFSLRNSDSQLSCAPVSCDQEIRTRTRNEAKFLMLAHVVRLRTVSFDHMIM